MTQTTKAGRRASGAGQRLDLRAAANPSQAHCTTGHVYAQGRVVGQVRGDTFCKTVSASRHMLRKPPAWALDLQSLCDAERLGARWVQFFDRDSGGCYRASVEQVRRHGFVFDRGHGRQIGLPLDRWTLTRPGEPRAEQLSLFEGVRP